MKSSIEMIVPTLLLTLFPGRVIRAIPIPYVYMIPGDPAAYSMYKIYIYYRVTLSIAHLDSVMCFPGGAWAMKHAT